MFALKVLTGSPAEEIHQWVFLIFSLQIRFFFSQVQNSFYLQFTGKGGQEGSGS